MCRLSHRDVKKRFIFIYTHTAERMEEVSKNAPNLRKLKVINLLPLQL